MKPPTFLNNPLSISAGPLHGVAINSDGSISAWGSSSLNKLNVPNITSKAVMVAAGGSHSLAVLEDGSVIAWGKNSNGQINVPSNLVSEPVSLVNADISGANLSGANFSDINLKNANLSNANLKGTILSGANLTNANLEGADLTGALFENTTFTSVQTNNLTKGLVFLNPQTFEISESANEGSSIGTIEYFSSSELGAASMSITSNVDANGNGTNAFILSGNELKMLDTLDTDYEAVSYTHLTLPTKRIV